MTQIPHHLVPAYKYCADMARAHYENFPVASVFLPRNIRPHVAAIYAFARTADDYADEIPEKSRRLRELGKYRKDLQKALANPASKKPRAGVPCILAAVACTQAMFELPDSELYRLLDAFGHDAREKGYRNLDDLNNYCRNSACSVGRLLLALFSVKNRRAAIASDALCTALQYTNFWQDLSRDVSRGRVTLPVSEAKRYGVNPVPGKIKADENLSLLLKMLITTTEKLYSRAAPLPGLVPKTLARQIRFTLAGGSLILGKAKTKGSLLLHERPRLAWMDAPALLWSAFLQ